MEESYNVLVIRSASEHSVAVEREDLLCQLWSSNSDTDLLPSSTFVKTCITKILTPVAPETHVGVAETVKAGGNTVGDFRYIENEGQGYYDLVIRSASEHLVVGEREDLLCQLWSSNSDTDLLPASTCEKACIMKIEPGRFVEKAPPMTKEFPLTEAEEQVKSVPFVSASSSTRDKSSNSLRGLDHVRSTETVYMDLIIDDQVHRVPALHSWITTENNHDKPKRSRSIFNSCILECFLGCLFLLDRDLFVTLRTPANAHLRYTIAMVKRRQSIGRATNRAKRQRTQRNTQCPSDEILPIVPERAPDRAHAFTYDERTLIQTDIGANGLDLPSLPNAIGRPEKFPGDEVEYTSIDKTLTQKEAVHFPEEFFHSLHISGLPPHILRLKIGSPVMVLRSVNPPHITNRTRCTVYKTYPNVIEVVILHVASSGKHAFIPWIPLVPPDSDLPFKFKRLQLPIRPCFAMTVNKSQGQTFKYIGIDLETPVFSHVSLSQVGSIDRPFDAKSYDKKCNISRDIIGPTPR